MKLTKADRTLTVRLRRYAPEVPFADFWIITGEAGSNGFVWGMLPREKYDLLAELCEAAGVKVVKEEVLSCTGFGNPSTADYVQQMTEGEQRALPFEGTHRPDNSAP